jgi:hypothetical protein
MKKLELSPVNPINRKERGDGTHEYQYCSFGPRPIDGYGKGAAITVSCRFDDSCKNGHDSFAITADIRIPGRRDVEACGCLHKEIAKAFPELAYLIPWHLVSTDSPMHYIANTVYHAGDRDHRGLRKGEPSNNPRTEEHFVQFGRSPISHKVGRRLYDFIMSTLAADGEFILDKVEHCKDVKTYGSKYQFAGMDCTWHECPFDEEQECREWITALTECEGVWTSRNSVIGEGKARDLDAARRCANWPEATDEQLCSEPEVLKQMLLERLPAMQKDFREAMESVGFTWLETWEQVTA